MKLQPWLGALALGLMHERALAARRFRAGADTAEAESGRATLHEAISSMADRMLLGSGGPTVSDILRMADHKMDMKEAVQRLDGKLSGDIASLLSLKQTSNPSEASLQNARRVLNNMMQEGWQELDDLMFESAEFSERNRGIFQQVEIDLARLGATLARAGEQRVASSGGISESDLARRQAEETLETAKQRFEQKRYRYKQQLAERRSDLAAFDFVLNLTACPTSSSFLQLVAKQQPHVKFCNTAGGLDLHFNNAQLQAQAERLMTPEARKALRHALGQMPMNFLQLTRGGKAEGRGTQDEGESSSQDQDEDAGGSQDKEDSSEADTNSTAAGAATTTMAPATTTHSTLPAADDPVAQEPMGAQWKRCVDTSQGCAAMHDLMSLEWGKFRDAFDRVAGDMMQNQDDYDTLKANINNQLAAISDGKTKHMEALAATISEINAGTNEMNEKDEERRALTEQYDREMSTFRAKIQDITYTKICALRTVRNKLLANSTTSPAVDLTDCDVSDWSSEVGECVNGMGSPISCDDSCRGATPNDCGGTERMRRDIVVEPSQYGMACPALRRQKRCAQKKCPVHCSLSEWSGWSRCSKDCEGGVQLKTRSILVSPRHGGEVCDAVQEERPCNTGSCDRDCELADWTEWTGCSVACSGGWRGRTREVLEPIRGNGRCPRPASRKRWNSGRCNTQDCVGDEICVAQQDLILAIDGSGSLGEAGFATVKQLAANLTMKYRAKYFGLEAIKMGVVLFGNGQLIPGSGGPSTVSPAIKIQALTDNLDTVKTAINGMAWQRGFSNMAQALALTDVMLGQGGRTSAQSAVLVISDGKYSLKYETAQRAQALKDKNVQVFMAPISEFSGAETDEMKLWASHPWQTNYLRIPGLRNLEYNAPVFVEQMLTKFCPDAVSLSLMQSLEASRQYILLREDGWPNNACGASTPEGVITSADECSQIAKNKGVKGFIYGKGLAGQQCFSVTMTVSTADFNSWQHNRTDPPCPNGAWRFNPYFDTYVINPSAITT